MIGTDLSDFQTLTDASAYKASGHSFAIVKLGEGMHGPGDHVGADKSDVTVLALSHAGVDVAGYWFVHPSLDGAAQGARAVAIAKSLGLKALACDCEVTDGLPLNQVAAVMHGFLSTVIGAGLSTLLYDNRSWIDSLSAEQWGYPIWYANPSVSAPDRACVCWQNGEGSVPGIAGTADLDVWVADQASYDAFFHPNPSGGDMPAPTDVVASWSVPGSGGATYCDLHADGGLFGYGGFDDAAFEYVASANDGARYHFGPTVTPGVISYPGLPASERQGTRNFVAMTPIAYEGKAVSVGPEGAPGPAGPAGPAGATADLSAITNRLVAAGKVLSGG